LLGENGDDALFAGNGGTTLTGGDGKDQFWVAFGVYQMLQTQSPTQVGTDVIGIAGLSGVTGFDDLTLRQSGMDTQIVTPTSLPDSHSHRVQADTLNSSNFAFAY